MYIDKEGYLVIEREGKKLHTRERMSWIDKITGEKKKSYEECWIDVLVKNKYKVNTKTGLFEEVKD